MANYYVDTDGVSQTYASLAAALAALPATFTEDNYIYCDASTDLPDTTTIPDTATNTTTNWRLYVICTSAYRFVTTNADRWAFGVVNYGTDFFNVTVSGMHFEKAAQSASYQQMLYVSSVRYGQLRLINCDFLGADVGNTWRDRLIEFNVSNSYGFSVVMANCRVTGRSTVVSTANSLVWNLQATPAYVYFCTFKGYKVSGTANANARWMNNVIKTTVAPDAVGTTSNYNQFSGAWSFGGANDRQSQTFTFADEANFDYHLSSSDTGAQNAGVDLSADAYYVVTTDADEVTRDDPPDCGAYEVVSASPVTGTSAEDSQPQVEDATGQSGSLDIVGTSAETAELSTEDASGEVINPITGTSEESATPSEEAATGTTTVSAVVIDHTAVALFDIIPASYREAIKADSDWLSFSGESHSTAMEIGLELVAAQYLDYAVHVHKLGDGAPEAPTTGHMRACRARWNGSSWVYGNGEEDTYTNTAAITAKKAEFAYADAQGLQLKIWVFGWCWDMTWTNAVTATKDSVYLCGWAGSSDGGPEGNLQWGLDAEDTAITGNSVCMDTYLNTIRDYIADCEAHGYGTTVCYSTGPVDGNSGNETGFQRQIKHEHIREFVQTYGGYLLDYADIEAWDNAGNQRLEYWSTQPTHPMQIIATDNMLDLDGSYTEDGDHIGQRGAVRLAKAAWVLAARIRGWDGNPETDITGTSGETQSPQTQDATGTTTLSIMGTSDESQASQEEWSTDSRAIIVSSGESPPFFIYSSDGKNWQVAETAISGDWMAASWSDTLGLFIAASAGSPYFAYSSDGKNWLVADTSVAGFWRSCSWSDTLGLFIATGVGYPYFAYSSDGKNWLAADTSVAGSWFSCTWSNTLGLFVAVGYDSPYFAYSSDGKNWLVADTSVAGSWLSCTWSDTLGLFVAASAGSPHFAYSSDGKNWLVADTSVAGSWRGCSWSDTLGLFVAAGAGSPYFAYSSDGKNWLVADTSVAGSWMAASWSDTLGLFVAPSAGSPYFAYSSDGKNWLVADTSVAGSWRGTASGEVYVQGSNDEFQELQTENSSGLVVNPISGTSIEAQALQDEYASGASSPPINGTSTETQEPQDESSTGDAISPVSGTSDEAQASQSEDAAGTSIASITGTSDESQALQVETAEGEFTYELRVLSRGSQCTITLTHNSTAIITVHWDDVEHTTSVISPNGASVTNSNLSEGESLHTITIDEDHDFGVIKRIGRNDTEGNLLRGVVGFYNLGYCYNLSSIASDGFSEMEEIGHRLPGDFSLNRALGEFDIAWAPLTNETLDNIYASMVSVDIPLALYRWRRPLGMGGANYGTSKSYVDRMILRKKAELVSERESHRIYDGLPGVAGIVTASQKKQSTSRPQLKLGQKKQTSDASGNVTLAETMEIETYGQFFAPAITLNDYEGTVTVLWEFSDSTTSDSLAPVKNFGSEGYRTHYLTVSPPIAVRRLNFGYDSIFGGPEDIETVSSCGISDITELEVFSYSLEEFCAVGNPELTLPNFRGFPKLRLIECPRDMVEGTSTALVPIAECPSLQRANLSYRGLQSVDVSDCANLQELVVIGNNIDMSVSENVQLPSSPNRLYLLELGNQTIL